MGRNLQQPSRLRIRENLGQRAQFSPGRPSSPAPDRVRITVAGNTAIFEALNADHLVGTIRAEFAPDSQEIVLREKSQFGGTHGVPGTEKVTERTVLFRNPTGDLVLEKRARGGMAMFYVIPVGFRETSTYVFRRLNPTSVP